MPQTTTKINQTDPDINRVIKTWQGKSNIKQPVRKELYFEMIDQMANLFSLGSFYYFILNFETFKVDMISEGLETVLGMKPRKYTIEELLSRIHPDDIKKMSEKENKVLSFFMDIIPAKDIPLYKSVYLMRLRSLNGTYKTILHQSKAIIISKEGQVQKTLCIHTDVCYLNIPIDHKISFISTKRPSYYCLEGDTKFRLLKSHKSQEYSSREKEILFKISQGQDFKQIAEELFISPNTVNTHKRNILVKSGCKNTAELMAKCIREGVI